MRLPEIECQALLVPRTSWNRCPAVSLRCSSIFVAVALMWRNVKTFETCCRRVWVRPPLFSDLGILRSLHWNDHKWFCTSVCICRTQAIVFLFFQATLSFQGSGWEHPTCKAQPIESRWGRHATNPRSFCVIMAGPPEKRRTNPVHWVSYGG